MKMNVEFYNLYLTSYNVEVDASSCTKIEFKMSSLVDEPKLNEFSRDVSVINAIRSNNDPTVKDAWEKLLTTIALTKGRSDVDIIDSIASKK